MKMIKIILLAVVAIFIFCSCSKYGSIDNVNIDYGKSRCYSKEDMDSAINEILNQFQKWEGCTLYTISYTSDEFSEENIDYCNKLQQETNYNECIIFESSFHTSRHGNDGFNPDDDYSGWQWILARSNGGQWKLLTWGY